MVAQQEFDPYELLDSLRASGEIGLNGRGVETALRHAAHRNRAAAIGAALRERTENRRNCRNGLCPAVTTAGDLEIPISKLLSDVCFVQILERRRRIDRALLAVVMEARVQGVSARKVEDLVTALGVGSGISKSVSGVTVVRLQRRRSGADLIDRLAVNAGTVLEIGLAPN